MTWTLSEPGAPKQGHDQDNLAQEMTKTNNNISCSQLLTNINALEVS